MAPRRGSIRARAASIIRSPLATIHQGLLHDPAKEEENALHQNLNEKLNGLERGQSPSLSSGSQTTTTHTSTGLVHDREAQRLVRSIPPWVHTTNDLNAHLIPGTACFPTPSTAHVAQHNSSPSAQRSIAAQKRKAKDDDWEPPWPGAEPEDTVSRWKAYKSGTAYPLLTPYGGQVVSEEWWRENGPDYDSPWLPDQDDMESEDVKMRYRHGIRQRAWYLRLQRTVLRSPIVPMIIRLTVMTFSIAALGLAASIHHLSNNMDDAFGQRPSADMAIIVDAVAIVYLSYITYDEYSGKPLGLRSARAKIRLIFLDLFFIVFDSANLSLAFATLLQTECLYDRNQLQQRSCNENDSRLFVHVFRQQRALASVLLLALVAWLMTFSISVARLVEKIGSR